MIRKAVFGAAIVLPALLANYAAYFYDGLTSISSTNWYQNGTLSVGASGITTTTAGAIVSKVTAPTYPNDYMLNANVNLTAGINGGFYGIMARASTNAYATTTTATGSFYMAPISDS